LRLQRAFLAGNDTPGPQRGAAGSVPGLVEALTPREMEILGMLAAGRSNQTIAGELVLTLDTVKKHVSMS
jgi:LuxR family maltose regulon positive regulatory protein